MLRARLLGVSQRLSRCLTTSTSYASKMYSAWLENPQSVHVSWQNYFKSIKGDARTILASEYEGAAQPTDPTTGVQNTLKTVRLLQAFQINGHLFADLDPLKLHQTVNTHIHARRIPGSARLENYGFTPHDMEQVFCIGSELDHGFSDVRRPNGGRWKLKDLIEAINKAYCNKIGFEFMHIPFRDECNWIRNRVEVLEQFNFSKEEKLRIYESLARSTLLEQFFHKKYPTHKRFGLDGLEIAVPALEALSEHSVDHGVDTFIIGMPHRGRLNVLANVLSTPLEEQFAQFFGNTKRTHEEGDVKYHLGRTVERTIKGKKVSITLLANPSHLEAVDPVVLGKTRAVQDYQNSKNRAMAIMMHGDASLAGQGIVYETAQMEDLYGYTTGGTIHIVVNNNIGFTTSPRDARSGVYPTEVAKTTNAPVFHVNGDHPEEVVFVSQLAADWRAEFRNDVYLDIIGYRKHGHNETDEPMFTNPLMYKLIKEHKPCIELYRARLIEEGILTTAEADAIEDKIRAEHDYAFKNASAINEEVLAEKFKTYTEWSPINLPKGDIRNTGISVDRLKVLGYKMSTLPPNFNAHANIMKLYKQREQSIMRESGIDWGTGEALAWASLLVDDKTHVRISGEDVERGTFSHRHSVLKDQSVNGKKYTPLQNLDKDQAKFTAVNSLLSEYGVLGFEYGYSIANPNSLVIWEAQFGDFANGAQIIFDQFICSGEAKWGQQTGLVVLLPHGYDGQGAEHSCGRMERLLQLSADHPNVLPSEQLKERNQILYSNIQVCMPSTPANYFHMLRRQIRRDFRKPLFVMSPKRLLRHKSAVSDLKDFSEDRVRRVIDDKLETLVEPKNVRKVLFCSGQIYYDLVEEREKLSMNDVAIVRLEQIAPFPFDKIQQIGSKYSRAMPIWVQEEPLNLGGWFYVCQRFDSTLSRMGFDRLKVVSRPPHAAAATGYASVHQAELRRLLDQAFE
jgi:2-oxoglutarate dehydrogenase E1 component